jgi:hypothetical protein
MTFSSIVPAVRAARRLSPLTVRALNSNFILNHCHPLTTDEQCSRFGARRWESTGTEPPPAGGHLPSISTSKILRTTREAALRTPGIKWLDEDGSSPLQNTIGGRETRKMNVYQAVRDAMAYVRLRWLVVPRLSLSSVLPLRKMIQPSSLARTSRSVECSGVPW